MMRAPRIVLFALLTMAACAGTKGVATDQDAGEVDAGIQTDLDAGMDAGPTPCEANFHRCNGHGLCRFDMDPDFCGDTCTVCPNDEYTTGTCDGTSCQVTCKNGGHLCGDRCVPEDGSSCGSTCMQCPTAVNGAPACVDHQCALSCIDNYVTCGDGRCGASPAIGCTADGDCCQGTCAAGFCCALPGTTCRDMTDCNSCFNGQPQQCVANKCCVPVAGHCESNADCCSGHCDGFIHTCFQP